MLFAATITWALLLASLVRNEVHWGGGGGGGGSGLGIMLL